MVVVTGMARTGTSLMMRILLSLGFETPADKFMPEHKDIMDKNPDGFYDMGDEILDGVHSDKWKGKAVKIFPGSLAVSNPQYIDYTIICEREREECLESYKPVHEALQEDYTPEYVYDASVEILRQYKEIMPHVVVRLDDMKREPETEIQRVCDYLNINPEPEDFESAFKRVNKCHY